MLTKHHPQLGQADFVALAGVADKIAYTHNRGEIAKENQQQRQLLTPNEILGRALAALFDHHSADDQLNRNQYRQYPERDVPDVG